jgi:hypothetical protein
MSVERVCSSSGGGVMLLGPAEIGAGADSTFGGGIGTDGVVDVP